MSAQPAYTIGNLPAAAFDSMAPLAMRIIPENVPLLLREQKQWVVWKYGYRDGQLTKVPYVADFGQARKASSIDALTWRSFDQALEVLRWSQPLEPYLGIGYMLAADDGVVGSDMDRCIDPHTRDIAPWAQEIKQELGTYTEVSPSGTGLRLICLSAWPDAGSEGRHRQSPGFEMYNSKRFLTVTGWHVPGTPSDLQERTDEVRVVHARMFPPRPEPVMLPTARSRDGSYPYPTDEEIRGLGFAESTDKFRRLWDGDTSMHDSDDSRADQALCCKLAFYTRDASQIERLFSDSALGKRDKWARRPDYRARTINFALAHAGEEYDWTPGATLSPHGSRSSNERGAHERGPDPARDNARAPSTFTGAELLGMVLTEPKWAVPTLLPEGLSILGGKPKMGKSWMALGMSVAIATGGHVLGSIPVEPGEVLYLALEDNARRLQKRLKTVLSASGSSAPDKLTLATEWPRLDAGGQERLDLWLEEHPDARLVVIDTWARLKPRQRPGANQYDEDYASVTGLQKLAGERGVAIVIVTHLRKMSADDPLDTLNATLGFSGGADSVLILRRERGGHDAGLFVSGRDVEEQELALRWHSLTATWSVLGNAEQYRMSEERRAVMDILRDAGRPMTPKEVADLLGKNHNAVKKLMWTMSLDNTLVVGLKGAYTVR